MTPQEWIDQVGQLIADGRDEEALEVARRGAESMLPRLSPEELVHVAGMLETAQMAVELATAEQGSRAASARLNV